MKYEPDQCRYEARHGHKFDPSSAVVRPHSAEWKGKRQQTQCLELDTHTQSDNYKSATKWANSLRYISAANTHTVKEKLAVSRETGHQTHNYKCKGAQLGTSAQSFVITKSTARHLFVVRHFPDERCSESSQQSATYNFNNLQNARNSFDVLRWTTYSTAASTVHFGWLVVIWKNNWQQLMSNCP